MSRVFVVTAVDYVSHLTEHNIGQDGAMTARDGGAHGTREQRAEATRTLILDTAERLYAEHGLQSVSNRQISEAAGQGNNTAVGYHFGTKADLVRAIVRRHQVDVEARRDSLLADIDGPATIRDWIECLVRPTAEHLASVADADGQTSFARVSGQLLMDPELRPVFIDETESESLRAALDGLDQSGAELPDIVRAERNVMSRQLMTWGFAQRESALARGRGGPDWDEYATIVIDAMTGLWLAPWTPPVTPAGPPPASR
jgi:AcrR family transcriptional regulator